MRLLVVGKLNGQLSTAVKMAMAAGAKVSHVETIEAATHALRAGQGADLLMVDFELDIAGLIAANEAERIRVPVVACGVNAGAAGAAATGTSMATGAAGAATAAGAKATIGGCAGTVAAIGAAIGAAMRAGRATPTGDAEASPMYAAITCPWVSRNWRMVSK